uniref:Uncharacterized protein n=1 Tax=Rhizophora mucronata TaxID=61149 RepID=A0A2P2LP50_RHIMU
MTMLMNEYHMCLPKKTKEGKNFLKQSVSNPAKDELRQGHN